MKIAEELIRKQIADRVWHDIMKLNVQEFVVAAEGKAISILGKIQGILAKNSDDFDKIEKIVLLFEENGLDFCGCHDFS